MTRWSFVTPLDWTWPFAWVETATTKHSRSFTSVSGEAMCLQRHRWLAVDRFPSARGLDHSSFTGDNLTPTQGVYGPAGTLPAFIETEIDVAIVLRRADCSPFVWIPDDKIGITTYRHSTFARVQAEELRCIGRRDFYEPLE